MAKDNKVKKITEKGRENLQAQIEKLREDLKKLRDNKASAYTQTGDTWHDNPYFNQLERDEMQLIKQIAEIQETIENAEILDNTNVDTEKISIGSIFKCACVYEDFDEPEEEIYEIVGQGENDIDNGKIHYESPVAKHLLGHKLNDVVKFETPAGKVSYTIIKIYKDWAEAKAD